MPGAAYLHFSCHGQFDPNLPLISGLLLSNAQFLALLNVLSDLSLDHTRLTVLSACQTAITDFKNLPDEAIGLPAGFLQAGVQGVIGTLWPVEELSTALLLERFYQLHLENNLPPVQALRDAQRFLRMSTAGDLGLADLYKDLYLNSSPRLKKWYDLMRYYQASPQVVPFDHPYYWAAFTFNGL
jgi:CHAT domain-containing protein